MEYVRLLHNIKKELDKVSNKGAKYFVIFLLFRVLQAEIVYQIVDRKGCGNLFEESMEMIQIEYSIEKKLAVIKNIHKWYVLWHRIIIESVKH